MDIALAMLQKMFLFTGEGDGYPLLVLGAISCAFLIQFIGKYGFDSLSFVLEKLWYPFKLMLITLLCAIIFKLGPDGVLPFIYFQF